MIVWDFIQGNPDLVISAVAAIAGLFGWHEAKQARRASTQAESDRWAGVAAAAIVVQARGGILRDDDAALAAFQSRYLAMAAAAGVDVLPEHLSRALAIGHEVLSAAGQLMMAAEATKLSAVASQFEAAMKKLPWPKAPVEAPIVRAAK